MNIFDYLSTTYKNVSVKIGSLNTTKVVETIKLWDYHQRVLNSYQNGTIRLDRFNYNLNNCDI